MLRLLASGVPYPERLAACAQGHLRVKIPALILELDGRPDAHFRWMLAQLLAKLDRLEEERACADARIDLLAARYEDRVRRLSTIPGVDRTTALVRGAALGRIQLADSQQETRVSGADAGNHVFVREPVSAWVDSSYFRLCCDCETRGEDAHARGQGG